MRRLVFTALVLVFGLQGSGLAASSPRSFVGTRAFALHNAVAQVQAPVQVPGLPPFPRTAPVVKRNFPPPVINRPSGALAPMLAAGMRVQGPAMLGTPILPRNAPRDPRAMNAPAPLPSANLRPLNAPLVPQTLGPSRSVRVAAPNVLASPAVVGSQPALTGINHWWSYEEGAIPGVGKYMVNVASGNLLVQSDDMAVPHKGIGFDFRRTYNSQSQHDYANTDGSVASNYGVGWTNNFDAHIAYNQSGGISLFDLDGARYDYTSDGNGHWVPPAGQYGQLVPDGNAPDHGYFWFKKSGTVYYFWSPGLTGTVTALAGRIYRIWGRNYNCYLTFNYSFDGADASSPSKLASIQVLAENGDYATLNFSSSNPANQRLLASLIYPDHTTQVSYFYDAGGNLQYVAKPGNNSAPTLWDGYIYSGGKLINAVSPRWIASNGSDGAYIGFAYDGSGRVNIVGAAGFINPTPSDGTGSVLQPGYPTGSTLYYTNNFVYGTSATQFADSDGHQIQYSYDALGRVTQTQAATGSVNPSVLTSNQGWDAANNLIFSTDPRGNRTDYAYDASGNAIEVALPAVTSAQGTFRPTSIYSYDANFNITAYCDPNKSHSSGLDWAGTPPPSDNLCPQTAGATIYSWLVSSSEPYGELVQMTTPLGRHHSIAYAPSAQGGADYGLPSSVTGDAFSQFNGTTITPTQTFGYDARGNLVSYSRGSGSWGSSNWTLSYDALGHLTQITDPDSVSSYKYYFADGALQATESAAQYAGSSSHPSNAAVLYTYDADGDQKSELHHYGNIAGLTSKWYDGADRLVAVQQPQSDFPFPWATRYIYDLSQGATVSVGASAPFRAYGNLYKTQEYVGRTPYTATAGKTIVAGSPPGWTDLRGNAFDAMDRAVTKYSYAPGNATIQARTFTYDGIDGGGQPQYGLLSSQTDPLGETTRLTYDADGRQTAISFSGDGGVTPARTYSYDADGRATTITSSRFGAQSASYDLDGEVTSVTEAGNGLTGTSQLSYDYYPSGARKSLSVAPAPGSSSSFSQSNLFQYAYRSDGARNMLSVTYGGRSQLLSWTFTPAGRQLTQSDPYTGMTFYNPNLRVNPNVTLSAASSTYDSYGRLQYLQLPETVLYGIQYDAENEPTLRAMSMPADSYSASFTYNYSANAELLLEGPNSAINASYNGFLVPAGPPVSPLHNPNQSAQVQFDPLTSAKLGGSYMDASGCGTDVESHSYDAAGRHTFSSTQSWSGHVTPPSPEPQPTSSPSPPPNGCDQQTTITHTRTYDPEDHTLSDTQGEPGGPPGPPTQLDWGPNGHFVKETMNGAGSPFTAHWDGDQILFVTNANGALIDLKVESLADIYPPAASGGNLVINDRDESGTLRARHDGTGYSNISVPVMRRPRPDPPSAVLGNPGFDLGQQPYSGPFAQNRTDGYDITPGLTIQGVRAYDPNLQTWTTPDAYAGEVHDPMSQKPYMWNRNNPVMYGDPSGFCAEDLCIGEGAVVASGLVVEGALEVTAAGLAEVGDVAAASAIRGAVVRANAYAGAQFERALGWVGTKMPFTVTVAGAVENRIADFGNRAKGVIGEAKSGSYLSLTSQFKAYAAFLKNNTMGIRTFVLAIGKNTKLSKPLMNMLKTLQREGITVRIRRQ